MHVVSHCHYVQFSTLPLTTRYTTASTFHVAFPTAIELLQLPLVDNYTPACTTLQYFPPPSTTESTSCSIVPSPTSKHTLPHFVLHSHCHQPASTTALTTPSSFRVAIPIATRFTFPTAIDYSNYKLFYRPFSNQQTQRDTCLGIYNSFYSSFCICHAICPPPIIQPANTTATGIDNCFHCYDTTTDYMLFTQLTQQLKLLPTRVASPAYVHNSNHKIHTQAFTTPQIIYNKLTQRAFHFMLHFPLPSTSKHNCTDYTLLISCCISSLRTQQQSQRTP